MALEISAATPTQIVLKLASKNQDELKKVSIQISSGQKHTDFIGFAEDATTESFLGFKTSIGNIDTYVRSNNSGIARAKTADSSIAKIQELATDLAKLLVQRRNAASGDNIPFTNEAESILQKIADQLNIQFDGRYLFAGSKTDTRPVTNITSSNLGTGDAPTDIYYQGDNVVPTVKSSDSEEVEYGVLANTQAFKDLIGAAHLGIAADEEESDNKLGSAIDLVNSAISDLTSVRAVTQSAISKMDKSNQTHNDIKLLIQENLDKVSQTDIVQATSKMSDLQAIVQASYLAFTRLSNLRLTNFLN